MNEVPAEPEQGAGPVAERRAIIVAGPNGSGKSTLIRQLQTAPAFGFPENFINADNIAAELASLLDVSTQQERERAAFRRARELRREFRERGASHAFETVFSHPSTLLDMGKLRAAGFLVTLVFVTTSNPSINIGRVAARVRAGGHDVPRSKIADRYERAMGFLPRAVEVAHHAFIFDASRRTRLAALINSGNLYVESGTLPPYLVRRLETPLRERRDERVRIMAGLEPDERLEVPDEEAGVTVGRVRSILAHYFLQEVGMGTLLLHDRALCTSPDILR